MVEQYVVRSRLDVSDRKFRFGDRTRSIMLRLPGQAGNELTGCWLSTVGPEAFAPGFAGLVVVDRFLADLDLTAGDQLAYWYGGDIGTAEVLGPTFEEPMAPRPDELRLWADSDAFEPLQDWDLVIWDANELADLFFELAQDGSCRNHRYFLHLLYGRVGDAVRSGRVDDSIHQLIARSAAAEDAGRRLFAHRAETLIGSPALFDYDEWCGGGLSRSDEQ